MKHLIGTHHIDPWPTCDGTDHALKQNSEWNMHRQNYPS